MSKPMNKVIAVRARRNFMLSLYGGGKFNSTRGASYDKFPRNTLQRHNPKAVVESEVF